MLFVKLSGAAANPTVCQGANVILAGMMLTVVARCLAHQRLVLLLLLTTLPLLGQDDQFRNRIADFLRLASASVTEADLDRVEKTAASTQQNLGRTWYWLMLPFTERKFQQPALVDGGRARNSKLSWRCGNGKVAVLDNAYYCADSNAISYDGFFLAAISKKVGQLNHSPGDFAAILALAHENGHALQYQIGIRSLFGFPNEQNADCFAGSAAHLLEQERLLHPTDLAEAKLTLTLIADETKAGPLQDAHGNAEQRIGAFMSGYRSGPSGCVQFKPTAPTTRPPWQPR